LIVFRNSIIGFVTAFDSGESVGQWRGPSTPKDPAPTIRARLAYFADVSF